VRAATRGASIHPTSHLVRASAGQPAPAASAPAVRAKHPWSEDRPCAIATTSALLRRRREADAVPQPRCRMRSNASGRCMLPAASEALAALCPSLHASESFVCVATSTAPSPRDSSETMPIRLPGGLPRHGVPPYLACACIQGRCDLSHTLWSPERGTFLCIRDAYQEGGYRRRTFQYGLIRCSLQ
jgi:hypothetical protein